ncbi:MAG: hydantoinase B/oxoprolinase family protein, partial [Brevibacterium sp.]|nr:hydantoinase B/oxoprolinase family protein [Brevibacterium sp.]
PHGVWLNPSSEEAKYLGATFSNVSISPGDTFERPSAGGGGFGDPLERPSAEVLEDVIDDYVSIDRAAKDYGVVITEIDAELDEYEIDEAATARERARIRSERDSWLEADPAEVARQYCHGEITVHDVVRKYGVVLDWGTGEMLPKSTNQFRDSMRTRSAAHWG